MSAVSTLLKLNKEKLLKLAAKYEIKVEETDSNKKIAESIADHVTQADIDALNDPKDDSNEETVEDTTQPTNDENEAPETPKLEGQQVSNEPITTKGDYKLNSVVDVGFGRSTKRGTVYAIYDDKISVAIADMGGEVVTVGYDRVRLV